jgi:energy-coupling factor transporter ATP-binding protein EcfA2
MGGGLGWAPVPPLAPGYTAIEETFNTIRGRFQELGARLVLLHGNAGVGKSTLAQHMAHFLCNAGTVQGKQQGSGKKPHWCA